MSEIKIIGKHFVSNSGCEFVVLEKMYTCATETYYKIKFVETGTEKIVEKRNLRKGSVRDDYARKICGVACKGNANSSKPLLNKKAFKRWYAMVERCYKEGAYSYKSYGAKGVRISDEWLCFENFLRDIVKLDGYDEEKYIAGELHLDKDLSGAGIYSKETCRFLPKSINERLQSSKTRRFRAVSPEGECYFFDSQAECAKRFGLTARTIGKVLNKQLKSHKGWTFSYIV